MRKLLWILCLCGALISCGGNNGGSDDTGASDGSDSNDITEGDEGSDDSGTSDGSLDVPDINQEEVEDSGSDDGPDIPVTPEDIPTDSKGSACLIKSLGPEAFSEPECAWKDESTTVFGLKEIAVLDGVEGSVCLTIPALAVPKGGDLATIQWLSHRAKDIYGDHQILIDGELVKNVEASFAEPAFYKNVSIDNPSKSKVKLSFCAPNAVVEERWELGAIKVSSGDPPFFGFAGASVPPQIMLDLAPGTEKKLLVTVTDYDAQIEPFITFPKYELWNAPAWVTVNQQSVTWNKAKEAFHNFVIVNPPGGVVGTFKFSVIVTDHQGLKVNRWFTLNIQAPQQG
ncbi:MAG TPA: hypothetical protein EYN66_09385 [Myxococcales bacterium]|nr:hypothetical protein [Myxococcales bacterium]